MESKSKIGVPLFTAGVFRNGSVKFDEDDLQKVVDNYHTNKDKIKPIIKLTHGEEQIVLRYMAEQLGFDTEKTKDLKGAKMIGIGSVENLRLSEDKKTILGDILNIPEMFADFVNTTPTRRFSPEFYPTENGHMLRAISTVDIPENKEMKMELFTEVELTETDYITFSELKQEVVEMTKKTNTDDAIKLTEKLAEKQKALGDVETKLKVKETKLKDLHDKLLLSEIDAKVQILITAGNITKAQEDIVRMAFKVEAGLIPSKFDEGESTLETVLKTFKQVDLEKKTPTNDSRKFEEDTEKKDDIQKYEEEVSKLVKGGMDQVEAENKVGLEMFKKLKED